MAVVGRNEGARPAGHTAARAQARPWLLWLGLGALAVAALLLRAWTIRQSLPYVDHPDEPNPIGYVAEMLRTGDPNQRFFQKPSLYVYLILSAISAHYRLGLAAGTYGEIGQMVVTTHTVTTLPGFFLVARLVTATFGALTTLAAYGLGRRGWGPAAGLVGALYVLALPYHLRFSQWATTDVTAAFLACMSLSVALVALEKGTWRAYLVAGAFAGLAASAKYNAGAVAGAIAAAALLRAWGAGRLGRGPAGIARPLARELGRLAGAGLAAIGGFVAGTPYALLSWDLVGGGIARQWGNYGGANGHYRGEWNLGGYLQFFTGEGLGLFGCLAALAGLALLARSRPRELLVWLGFALPSLLIHLSRPTHFMQNMLPLLVACALPVGVAVAEGGRLLAARLGLARPLAAGALLLALLGPFALADAAHLARQAAGDSRRDLLAWMEANVPPGARVAAEIKPIPGLTEARWTDVPRLDAHDLAFYRDQGYAYLVASSNRWGQYELPASYAPLAEGRTVAEFGPRRREESLGPRLLVFATGLGPADAPLPPPGEVLVGGARLTGVALGDPSADGEPPMLRPTAEFVAGGVLGLRTFWQVEAPLPPGLFIFVHVLDAAGGRPTQRDAPPWQGRFPTEVWRPGTVVVDKNDVYLPPTMAPGEYRVFVGMYDPASGARPPVTLDGAPLPDGAVEVATIRVVAP